MAIGATLQLHGAKDPPESGVERILLRLELDCLVCERQWRHVLLVYQELRCVREGLHHRRLHDHDLRRPAERQARPEARIPQGRRRLRQSRAAAAEVDPSGKQVTSSELVEYQLHAGGPDRDVVADDLRDRVTLSDRQPAGIVHLQRLGARLPETATALRDPRFWKRLPFSRPPEVVVMQPAMVESITDATKLLVDQQDVTPLGLAYQAIELQAEQDALDAALRRVLRAMKL